MRKTTPVQSSLPPSPSFFFGRERMRSRVLLLKINVQHFLPTPLLPGCFLLLFCFLTCPPFTIRHMREIQALHSRQKEEIDCLFTKLGKVAGVCDTALCVLSKPAANCSSLGRRPGPSCRCAPARHHPDRQEETTDQKQILQIVQNQFCTQQQESATAR